ncbi:MAG: magnesium/cobalt efflux protein [Spirochaetaceae bacterium 4572_7]|nr:MAG: magnesium/cobalt efflux protein [Spirochaetaceae bacterium 4572_7]
MNIFTKIFGTEQNEKDTLVNSVETQDMIDGIVELSDTSVKDVYVPRIDVIFLSEGVTLNEILNIMEESGHSRFPVYRDTLDEIVGILYIKDLLIYIHKLVNENDFNITDVMRKAYFVPESKKLDSLLREFKRLHVHIAIAVDEYGGISGIVSMEDIIEEIVGDIQDEFDNETEDIVKIDDNAWLCDARTDIDEINDKLELEIEVNDIETIGGYVFNLIGDIPVKFEKIETSELTIIITEVDGHKIKRVKLVKKDV